MQNPYIYVTDHNSDFEGEKGVHLKDHFKKVFMMNYQKYHKVVEKVVPIEAIRVQMNRQSELTERPQIYENKPPQKKRSPPL